MRAAGEGRSSFVCAATYLPMRGWRQLLPFLAMSRRVRKQIEGSPGLVRCDVRVDLRRRRFWTLSVWRSQETMDTFVVTDAHALALSHFDDWTADGAAMTHWISDSNDLDWDEANARLLAAGAKL